MARNRKQKPPTLQSDDPVEPQTGLTDLASRPLSPIGDKADDPPMLSMNPAQRFHQEVQARIGNRICPRCGQPTFMAYKTKPLEDGSILRNRSCPCGYVADMVAPPEKPA